MNYLLISDWEDAYIILKDNSSRLFCSDKNILNTATEISKDIKMYFNDWCKWQLDYAGDEELVEKESEVLHDI